MSATDRPLRKPPTASTTAPGAIVGLRKEENALLVDMLTAFESNLLYARRYTKSYVKDTITRVKEFLGFANKPPWRCEESDFEEWCRDLVQRRRIKVRSERKYQGAIKGFFDYVAGNTRYRNLVRTDFGCELRQICTRDNLIPHCSGDDAPRVHKFEGRDLKVLFKSIDDRIADLLDPQWPVTPRELYPLARDRTMFFLMLVGGLRVSEVLGLDIDSFSSSATLPTLGAYACVTVRGKGHAGSGGKTRTLPLDNPQLPTVMQRYLDSVRPYFLRHSAPEEKSLFLAEHGGRMTVQNAWKRLKDALARANLDTTRFATHSFRRTGITSDNTVYSDIVLVSRKAGHSQLSTTLRYLDYTENYSANVLREALASRTRMLAKEQPADTTQRTDAEEES